MAAQDTSLAYSSAASLLSAMSRLLEDTDTADFAVTCGEKVWRIHSNILAIRSPFFKAAIANNMAEKSEMKMEIKDLDPKAMEDVINYMYGKPIGNAPLSDLLEASERFQMEDMKQDVIRIGSKSIAEKNVKEIGKLAELYNAEKLLQQCAEFIVKNDIEMKEEDLAPKLTIRVLSIYKSALKDTKQLKSSNCCPAQSPVPRLNNPQWPATTQVYQGHQWPVTTQAYQHDLLEPDLSGDRPL